MSAPTETPPPTSTLSPDAAPAPTPSAAAKDRITCHVLDTTTGQPARAMSVRLEGRGVLLGGGGSSAVREFESLTDDDGRVRVWLPYSSETASGEVPVCTLDDVLVDAESQLPHADGHDSTTWVLRFDTEGYFGRDKTFFPEVAVTFRVVPGEHYHVPLLLSPYSYTTYRGS